ncbi:IclR family transcriptional regulator [Aeromicrobium sp. Leaf350]|uniref:IclR family transcriptional regulator n=1 Tax=Aeromicrobium sp. Leaf350 TaxID=2876565 RepID=UPI001E555207|nr:IclR family transcriptional regulator [Aeromicrobium sp. Leaf350]
MASDESPPPPSVLGKAMAILESFTVDRTALTFSDLQAATGLPKATLHRHLSDLQAVGLIDRRDDRYRLSMLVFELGMRASVGRNLIEVATPFLEDLYERTHETVHLGVGDGDEVVYVLKMSGHQQAAAPSRLGGRMPLHATAIGKALLAHAPREQQDALLSGPLERRAPRTVVSPGLLREQLDECARSGVAFEYEESAVGVVCVAAPVLDATGAVIAAVSVAGPVTRFHPATHAAAVRSAALGIGATYGRRSARRR